MANLAGIAISGLTASKAALATVSHNIVNVDTDGYSRQRVELLTRNPQQLGGSFIGQGVDANRITRISNQFVTDQLRRDTQNFNSYDAFYDYAVGMDKLLGDDATALTPTLQGFFDSMQDLSTDPSSIAARQVLISQASALVNRFNTVYDQVFQQNQNLNAEIGTITTQITKLADSIANLNTSIRSLSTNSTGQRPNDLLDQRDEAVRQLSELVGVSVVEDSDGSLSVFVGSGQPLVMGGDSYRIDAAPVTSSIDNSRIVLTDGSTQIDLTDRLSGGRLGGLLDVREQLIDPIFNELGRMAVVLADSFNSQHQLGMDLNNELGGLFFGDINAGIAATTRVAADGANTGSAGISVTISDAAALTADNYELRFNGGTGNYSLINLTTNATVTSFANPGAGNSVDVTSDGITFNFSGGAPADGDSFLIAPTRLGASEMSLQINSVNQVAAALPVSTRLPSTNTGQGFVENVVVSDTTTAAFTTTPYALDPPYRVEFTSSTTYDVIDTATNTIAGAGVFTANQSNNLLQQAGLNVGYEVVFNGVPAVGDEVVIQYNNGGVSDNRNSLMLAELRTTRTIGNGTSTYQGAYGQLVSGVGARTRDAEIGQEAAQSILRQTESQRESISGVNLDEEAADLIRFQQSYQASARVIQVSSELFDSILSAL